MHLTDNMTKHKTPNQITPTCSNCRRFRQTFQQHFGEMIDPSSRLWPLAAGLHPTTLCFGIAADDADGEKQN